MLELILGFPSSCFIGQNMNWTRAGQVVLLLAVLGTFAGCEVTDGSTPIAEWHCDQSPLLIADVHLLGETEPKFILIEEGRIRWITSEHDDLPLPPNTRTLHGNNATAVPGLIDSHAHFDSLAAAQHLHSSLDTQTQVFPITMRQTLASGVTLARTHLSALADMALMSAISDDACFPSPRLSLSGPGLLGGASDVNSRLMRGVDGPSDASEKVDELADFGAEWVALHNIHKFLGSELTAIVSAADERGLQLMADTDGFEDLATALKWPITSGEYINNSIEKHYPAEIIAAISGRGRPFVVTPPVGYYRRSAMYMENPARLDSSLFLFVDDDVEEEMDRTFATDCDSDKYIRQAVSCFATHESKFQQLQQAGAVLVVGSDSGSLGQFHHDAVWHEMATWRAYGASIQETIAAATEIPAEMLGRSDAGSLVPGAHGDLVIYGGDIENDDLSREHVVAVVKGGVIYVDDHEWTGPTTEQTRALIAKYLDRR